MHQFQLHIVDLAGADYYGNISCSYRELFDVATGNLAKSQLEQFLLILCEDIPFHILSKQRLNTLIYYLKDSLNNESVLRFIGHIHTDLNNQMLTISMLRFAQIIKCLPPKTLASHTVENEDAVINRLQVNMSICGTTFFFTSNTFCSNKCKISTLKISCSQCC